METVNLHAPEIDGGWPASASARAHVHHEGNGPRALAAPRHQLRAEIMPG